jgi:myosin I
MLPTIRSAKAAKLTLFFFSQAVTKRAGRKKDGGKSAEPSRGGREKGGVKRAVFETTKKKEVGVSDLTLISKISNEAINENLKKRFENAEIYVRWAA